MRAAGILRVPIVRFDHQSGLTTQVSSHRTVGRGRGVGSHFISPVCGGGGRGDVGGRTGNKRSSQDYQLCSTGPDNYHLVRQRFQLFCVWGRWHEARIYSWQYTYRKHERLSIGNKESKNKPISNKDKKNCSECGNFILESAYLLSTFSIFLYIGFK